MAKSNKTEFAVLGILSLEPMSGYDIRGFVEDSINFFWQESYGQIYPALKRLHARRLVTKKKATQSKGPARYVYSITAKGRAVLAEWLATEPDSEPVRIELLLKLFFGAMGSPRDQIRNVESLMARQRSRLVQFKVAERELREHTDDSSHRYLYSTLRYGQLIARARVTWCKETLARLRETEDSWKSDDVDRKEHVPCSAKSSPGP